MHVKANVKLFFISIVVLDSANLVVNYCWKKLAPNRNIPRKRTRKAAPLEASHHRDQHIRPRDPHVSSLVVAWRHYISNMGVGSLATRRGAECVVRIEGHGLGFVVCFRNNLDAKYRREES